MFKRRAASAVAACLVLAALAIVSLRARASEEQAHKQGTMTKDQLKVISEQMMTMRETIKDENAMSAMQEQMSRMIVIEHMSRLTANDPEFRKMHEDLMKDPAVMRMMAAQKKAMADDAALRRAKELVMKDPRLVKMVMDRALMLDMLRRDPEMNRMMADEKSGEAHK